MSVRSKTPEAQPPGMAPGLRGQIFSLDRILPSEPDSPRAWIIVFAAFLSMFTLFAVAYSFGAFVTPMAAEFHSGHAAISAIFSITAFIYFLFGAAAGHIADRVGPRPMMVASALFVGTGLVLTSSINHLWLSYLTYGIGVGIGVACGYAPMVAAVSGWFVRRRNTALGIAVSGIGFGTIVGAPLAAKFIPLYGWRETYVLFGAASVSLLLLAAAMARRSPIARGRSGPTTGEALRTPAFMLLYASSFLCSVPLFVPFVFLPGFARDLGVNAVASAALIGVIGIGSVCGRLGLGALADRLGLVGLYLFCFLLQALSYAIWLGAHSYLTLVIFALAIGTGYGGYVALAPAVLAQFFGTGNLGALVGSLYTSNAFGTLIGPPLAGCIIDHTGGYRWAIATALTMATAAFLVLLPLPRIEVPDPAPQKIG
ncbi:MAG TPA: MFS transporter [Candidatus Binataceae bacterium]|nr:MFS transporter [Candidatus Binataceae bacterium]